jgi:hypothetical protein
MNEAMPPTRTVSARIARGERTVVSLIHSLRSESTSRDSLLTVRRVVKWRGEEGWSEVEEVMSMVLVMAIPLVRPR